MSYIVLARKWRPQDFDDLIGQEAVVKTIKNALATEKTAHAYLFSGPRGVGKTSAARILAKALNCSGTQSKKPCGTCQNCKAITNGSSMDVFEIDGASNTGVDDVRELREAVKYAPASGKYKIYIIDEIHMLSTQAFNALLKTLEEPPPHVIFIFATTEPKKVPSTILSRCQHHSFRKISKSQIKERLLKIAAAENIGIKTTAVEIISRTADGSMRDALTILDKASSFSEDISDHDLQILLGLSETDTILNISESILSGNISKTLSLIKELTESGHDLRPIVRELVEHFRNVAIVQIVQNPNEFLEFTEEEVQRLQQQASSISIEELTLILTEFLKLETEVRSSENPRYALELGLLKMSFIKGMTSIDGIMQKLNKIESQSPAGHHKINESSSMGGPQQKETQLNKDIKNKDNLWSETIKNIKSKDRLLAYKLAEAKIINITNTELTVGFNGGMSIFSDSVKKNSSMIENTLKDITGNKLRLKIVSLPGEKKNINETKEEIFSNPVFKNVVELFNGKLLKVKSLKNEEGTDDHG